MNTQPIDDSCGVAESAVSASLRRAAAPASLRLLERNSAPRPVVEEAPFLRKEADSAADPIAMVAEQIARTRTTTSSRPDPAHAAAESRRGSQPAAPSQPAAAPVEEAAKAAPAPAAKASADAGPAAADVAPSPAPVPAGAASPQPLAERSVLIGRSVVMQVAMQVPGRLVIDGLVSGDIEADEIVLRPGGRLEGRVSCRRAEMSGNFDGALFARDRVFVRSGARVTGVLVYGQAVQVEAGAVIDATLSASEGGLRKLGREPVRPRTVDEAATGTSAGHVRHSIFGRVLGVIGIA